MKMERQIAWWEIVFASDLSDKKLPSKFIKKKKLLNFHNKNKISNGNWIQDLNGHFTRVFSLPKRRCGCHISI